MPYWVHTQWMTNAKYTYVDASVLFFGRNACFSQKNDKIHLSGVFFFILFFFQVIDQSGQQMGEFTDVSQVEKFEMSNQAYEKRTGAVRLTFSLIVNPIWLKFSITFFFVVAKIGKEIKSNKSYLTHLEENINIY